MTERSWFWLDGGGGDASLSPYTTDEIADAIENLTEWDSTLPSILSRSTRDEDSFIMTFSGTTVSMSGGSAKIDGRIYLMYGIKSFDCSQIGYYRLVLRKKLSVYDIKGIVGGQTVMLEMLYDTAKNGVGIQIKRDSETFDQVIGSFYSNGSLVYPCNSDGSASDHPGTGSVSQRYGTNLASKNTVNLLARQGGASDHWATVGATMYVCAQSRMEVGSYPVGANPQAVIFAKAFAYNPIVIVQPFDAGSNWTGNNWCVSAISTTGFSVRFDAITNLDQIHYLAIGPEY